MQLSYTTLHHHPQYQKSTIVVNLGAGASLFSSTRCSFPLICCPSDARPSLASLPPDAPPPVVLLLLPGADASISSSRSTTASTHPASCIGVFPLG